MNWSQDDDTAQPQPRLTLDEICLSNPALPQMPAHPSTPPIYTAAVYQCDSTEMADAILGGQQAGYAYQRDAHPNADRLAEKCRQMHRASWAAVTSSGMSALSAIVLGTLKAGDHLLVSNQLYGRSSVLLEQQLPKFGIDVQSFAPDDLTTLGRLHRPGRTRLVIAETIANPLLRIVDIPQLVELGRELDFQVAIDNTFATPYCCQPLTMGVDWVWESYSKMLNGHSDVMMGLVAGRNPAAADVEKAISTWGLSSAPFECYLAERGLTTFGLRIRTSIQNAMAAADYLAGHPGVERVHYPGLSDHPDYQLADSVINADEVRQLESERCRPAGNVVTMELKGDVSINDRHSVQVQRFLDRSGIPYYPSLGECNSTLSHPCSSSHRHLTAAQRSELGIHANTLRLCVGIEPWTVLRSKLASGLAETRSETDNS